jgi:hypothetical protein
MGYACEGRRVRNGRSAVTTTQLPPAFTTSTMVSSPLPAARTTSTPGTSDAREAAPSSTSTGRVTHPKRPSGSASTPDPAAATFRSRRSAAPVRSRHQPSGREPTTLAASTTSLMGITCSAGQPAAKAGCRLSAVTSPSGIQASSVHSMLGRTGSGSVTSATTLVNDQASPPGWTTTSPRTRTRQESTAASSAASRNAVWTGVSALHRAPPGIPQRSPWCVHGARCCINTSGRRSASGARSSNPAAPNRPHRVCPSPHRTKPSPSSPAVSSGTTHPRCHSCRHRRNDRPRGDDTMTEGNQGDVHSGWAPEPKRRGQGCCFADHG